MNSNVHRAAVTTDFPDDRRAVPAFILDSPLYMRKGLQVTQSQARRGRLPNQECSQPGVSAPQQSGFLIDSFSLAMLWGMSRFNASTSRGQRSPCISKIRISNTSFIPCSPYDLRTVTAACFIPADRALRPSRRNRVTHLYRAPAQSER